MQKCANCGHENRPGVMYCENCGTSLAGEAPLDTKSIDASTEKEKAQLGIEESVLTDVQVQGSALFGDKDLLRLDIEGSSEPIIIKPEPETIFGRRDPATGAMPDVDLTPFAGYRMGVSRRHAAIRFGDEQVLNLYDLGSSNGTYLNGERLNAHRPYRLHDGDELRLGQMMIRIRFQPPSAAPQPKGEQAEKDAWVEAKEEKAPQASPAKPVKSEVNAFKIPAASSEKPAGSPAEKPAEAPEKPGPIETGPPKEQAVKPAASAEPPADLVDRVIKLPPTTDIFETPVGKVKRPEKKLERKPDEEKKTDEKPEVPTTKPIEDEQRPKLKAQAAVPPEATKEPEVTDKKGDVDSDQKDESGSDQKSESDQKNESDSAAPPVKPDSESEDKEKRD